LYTTTCMTTLTSAERAQLVIQARQPFFDEKCSFPVFYSSLNSSKRHEMAAWAFRG
jgi:hypothetical protein